jgi:hypothetical protein
VTLEPYGFLRIRELRRPATVSLTMPLRKISTAIAAIAICLAFAASALAASSRPAKHVSSGHRIGTALCIVKVHGHIRRCPHFHG